MNVETIKAPIDKIGQFVKHHWSFTHLHRRAVLLTENVLHHIYHLKTQIFSLCLCY